VNAMHRMLDVFGKKKFLGMPCWDEATLPPDPATNFFAKDALTKLPGLKSL
jgi:hypothetical protein